MSARIKIIRELIHRASSVSNPWVSRHSRFAQQCLHAGGCWQSGLQAHSTAQPLQTRRTGRIRPPAKELVKETIKSHPQKNTGQARLVIFDKDGTLICFHTMWSPWARKIASKIAKACNKDLEEVLYDTLGVCTETHRILPGLLAEATTAIIQAEVTKVLVEEGLEEKEAARIVRESWEEGDTGNPNVLKALDDLKKLFTILKGEGVKIAVCTSDNRKGTEATLKELGLIEHVDMIVCGDDPGTFPKPNPFNAHFICQKLNVKEEDTVMIGDTVADVKMGKDAGLGWSIGVLSGVCGTEELEPYAQHVVHSVKDLLAVILPRERAQKYYAYTRSSRILKQRQGLPLEIHPRPPPLKQTQAVIFDLHGTLMCPHIRYAKWLKKIVKRLEAVTGLTLASEVYAELGMDAEAEKLKEGVLASGTPAEVQIKLAKILLKHDYYWENAFAIIRQVWDECQKYMQLDWTPLHNADARKLFQMLHDHGILVFICTESDRDQAVGDLNNLGLIGYVDGTICGDDPLPMPAVELLKYFQIEPKNIIIVGDTVKDMKLHDEVQMKVGVLSGLGTKQELEKHADHIIPDIGHLWSLFGYNSADPSHCGTGQSGGSPPSGVTGGSSVTSRFFSSIVPMFKSSKRTFSTGSRTAPAVRNDDIKTYDYVIVGAGSAGCVLANRLSADAGNRVLLLEAGPKDDSWKIHMPAALMYNLCDDKYNWFYHTQPEPHVDNRVMYWPRGRVWGGSSSLNAMVYIRGHAYDYDRWEQEGAKGWSYADCLPYFRKAQCHELGEDDYRGGSGPLHVSRGKTNHPLHQAFIEAGVQAGYPFTEDMNGYQQEGMGWADMTIYKGERWNAARAYLRPILYRRNLFTENKALITRILFDKQRAVGVRYEQDGTVREVRADKEVILSGGAINSPQLLLLSGVGPPADLEFRGIKVVADRQGVGKNLQDHLEVYVQQKCTKPITLYTAQWKFPHHMVAIGLEWFTQKTGWGATAHLESGGFVRSRPDVPHPDIQFHFLPSVVEDHGRKTGSCHAYQVHVGPMRPESRGYLKLRSPNPKDHPIIVANYLSTPRDMQELRDSVRISREIFAQKAFDEFRGPELFPGEDVQTDEQIEQFIRRRADSAYHPSCTCKMGAVDDPMAVVDSEAKVIGVEGLRVVDASIMPSVVSGNLNGPTIMVAEKAADIILGRPPLPRSQAPVWKPPSSDVKSGRASQKVEATLKA